MCLWALGIGAALQSPRERVVLEKSMPRVLGLRGPVSPAVEEGLGC